MRSRARFLFAAIICVGSAWAANIGISVVDAAGLPLKDVLVVVQSLERGQESCRALTDTMGRACGMELSPGLYRAIATTPYGLWNTTAVEFLASQSPSQVRLKMSSKPTHGYGDVVTIGNPTRDLQVLQSNGQPAAKAKVLVRDSEVTLSLVRWYTTDALGKARIELVAGPAIVVVVFEGMLVSQEVSATGPSTIRLPARAIP